MFRPILLLASVSGLLQAPRVNAAAAVDSNPAARDNDGSNADLLASAVQRLQRLEQELGVEKQQWQREKERWEEERQQWGQEMLQREGEDQDWQSFKQDMLGVLQSLDEKIHNLEGTPSQPKHAAEDAEISRETRRRHKDDWEEPLAEVEEEIDELDERLKSIQGNFTEAEESLKSRIDTQALDIRSLENKHGLIKQAVDVVSAMLQGVSNKVDRLHQANGVMVSHLVNLTVQVSSNAVAARTLTVYTQALDFKTTTAMRVYNASSELALQVLDQKIGSEMLALRNEIDAAGEHLNQSVQTLMDETQALNETISDNVHNIHNDMGFTVRGLFRVNDDVDTLRNETSEALDVLESKMDTQSQTLDSVMTDVIQGLAAAGVII